MEKIYHKTVMILTVLTFISFSCKKDSLDQKPTSSITELTYYKNVNELETGLDACYAAFKTWMTWGFDITDWVFGDVGSDDADCGSLQTDQPDIFNISYSRQNSSNGWMIEGWMTYYIMIARCNQVIDKSPGAQSGKHVDSVLIERIVNQAKFLRAFSYYYLVTSFGDVPLVVNFLNPDEINLKRAPADDIWTQIEKDLTDAVNLPAKSEWNQSNNQSGRVTSGAAWSLLGKVYLTERKYDQANSAFSEVVNSGEYQLVNDFGKIFRKEGDNCEESVFELQTTNDVSLGGNLGTWNAAMRLPRDPGQGYGFDCPTQDLLEEFELEPGDPRIIYTFLFPGDVFPMGTDTYTAVNNYSPTGYNSRKVWVPWAEREGLGIGDWAYNYKFIRYAEVLLLYAESLNESNKPGEVLKLLNQVRTRARNTPTTDPQRIFCAYDLSHTGPILPDVTTTNYLDLQKAIWHEQRVELAIEGKRRNMLLRIGQFKDRMEAAKAYAGVIVEPHELLFPIPQQEIELSNHVLIQNPGY
jgi:starch-binding outer membrane protein, SusD/RagB family